MQYVSSPDKILYFRLGLMPWCEVTNLSTSTLVPGGHIHFEPRTSRGGRSTSTHAVTSARHRQFIVFTHTPTLIKPRERRHLKGTCGWSVCEIVCVVEGPAMLAKSLISVFGQVSCQVSCIIQVLS